MRIPVDPVALTPALAFLYKGWYRSISYSTISPDSFLRAAAMERLPILALWHHDLFALISYGLKLRWPLATIVSDSKDGEIITQVLQRVGFVTARGSSTRGGLKAVVRALRLIKEGHRSLAITIDGPRGPRHEPKEGVLYMAAKSGTPIMPVAASVRGKYEFSKSWDRFQMPFPFSSIRVAAGEPYFIEGDLTEDRLATEKARLHDKMLALANDPRMTEPPTKKERRAATEVAALLKKVGRIG